MRRAPLVSGYRRCGSAKVALHGVRLPPNPVRGSWRPSPLRPQPWVSPGTGCRGVTHDRTVAGLPVAWTRQVTVAKTICGVDVSSTALDARIGHDDGPWGRFDRSNEGIAGLIAFCRTHAVDLVVMEATGDTKGCHSAFCGEPTLQLRSSIPARCAASPKQWACWKRPTASMPVSSPPPSQGQALVRRGKAHQGASPGRRHPAAAYRTGHSPAPAYRNARRPAQPAAPGG